MDAASLVQEMREATAGVTAARRLDAVRQLDSYLRSREDDASVSAVVGTLLRVAEFEESETIRSLAQGVLLRQESSEAFEGWVRIQRRSGGSGLMQGVEAVAAEGFRWDLQQTAPRLSRPDIADLSRLHGDRALRLAKELAIQKDSPLRSEAIRRLLDRALSTPGAEERRLEVDWLLENLPSDDQC